MNRLLLSFMMVAFALFSCDEEVTTKNLTVDPIVEEQAAFGFEVNQMVSSGAEVMEVTMDREVDYDADLFGVPLLAASRDLADQGVEYFDFVKNKIDKQMLRSLSKASAEIPLFFADTVLQNGDKARMAILYDFDTQIMRFYVAIYEFGRTLRNVTYDSLQVRFSITDLEGEDAEIVDIMNYREFTETFLLDYVSTLITVNSWVDDDIESFTAQTISVYNGSRNLERVERTLTVNADDSGTITETFYFKNGETTSSTFTYNVNGSGTFSRQLRNGITIEGSFDTVEDDGQGFYQATTNFPGNGYLVSIFKSAIVSYTEGLFNGEFDQSIIFRNGNIDSVHIEMTYDEENGISTLNITKSNGAFGTFTIVETDDIAVLNGNWTTWDGYYIVIYAEYYEDDSSYLSYKVYQNETDFNNGEDPLIEAEYNFGPDYNGNGILSYK